MRVLLRVMVFVAPLLVAVSLTAQSLDVELQRAVQREIASGDIKRAIEEYRRIADRAGSNRAVAAQALLRLAEAHQKLGDSEANRVYEQIVNNYSDQGAIVATARARLTTERGPASTGMALRRIWSGPEVERSAPVGRVSPDGRYLAFPSNITHELVVRNIPTGSERVLLRVADAIFWQPLWYPDGKRIAFVVEYPSAKARPAFEIRSINLDGSGMRTIMTNETDMGLQDWSRDGTRILAMMDDPAAPRQAGDCHGCTDGVRLFWVDATTGTTTTIATALWAGRFEARLSPDGRYVAFGGLRGSSGTEIHIVQSDGGGRTTLSADPQDLYPVTWTPDSRNVVVASARAPGVTLWTLPVANGKPNGDAAMLTRELCAGCTSVTPWGTTRTGAFYFSTAVFSSEMYTALLDPATGKIASAPIKVTTSRSGFNVLPKWSSDGRRLLYQWGTANTAQRILNIASVDTRTDERLDWLPDFPGGYCWSGNEAILIRRNLAARRALYRVNLKSRQETLLFEAPPGLFGGLVCTNDEKLVGYVPPGTFRDTLRLRNLETDTLVERALPSRTRQVHLSPDTTRMVIVADNPKGTGLSLFVAPVAGGAPRELVQATPLQRLQATNGVAWSGDGRYVYFSRGERDDKVISDYDYHVFRIPVDGGPEVPVGLKGRDLRDLSVSPDGRRIAYSVGALNRPEVWAVENFLPTAK